MILARRVNTLIDDDSLMTAARLKQLRQTDQLHSRQRSGRLAGIELIGKPLAKSKLANRAIGQLMRGSPGPCTTFSASPQL